jgi:hypothetical protein
MLGGHMKIGEIGYNSIKEEGYIKINWKMMPETDNVVTLDILQDWIVELQDIYEEKREIVFKPREKTK